MVLNKSVMRDASRSVRRQMDSNVLCTENESAHRGKPIELISAWDETFNGAGHSKRILC